MMSDARDAETNEGITNLVQNNGRVSVSTEPGF